MGGKHKKVTVGYWYHPAFHMGISLGPIDALLEIRGGDLTAWSGSMTASGTLTVSAPNLWGGEKDQGGIAGDFDLMMGEPTQQPNAYLTQTFGDQQPAWRGLTSIVFKGGRYGAMNPYPQKISYKGLKITHGWDGDPGDGSACWYPAKAAIAVAASQSLPSDATGWDYQVLPDEADPGNQNLAVPTDGWTVGGQGPFGSGPSTIPYNTAWPGHTVLWIRRTLTVSSPNQTLTVRAENGCVVFINGAIAAASNRSNVQIAHNENNPAIYALAAGQTYEIAVKAFDEKGTTDGNVTLLSVEISSPGLTAMNPAHTLYYARTQQHMGREPAANVDGTSHQTAADWFYSQGFGICWDYDPSQESVDAFIARIEKVSGCSQTRSPVDGKWYLDVANGQYDVASLPILTDDDILDFQRQPTTLDSAVNSVSVQYFDAQLKTDVITPPVEALALVNAFGTIHQDVTYKEIPTSELAARVAQRDLQGFVTPTNGFEITCTRKPYAWRRGTYFRLQSVKRGIADMVCILGDIDTGTLKSGAIKITAAQDIYSLPASSFVQQEPGVDTRPPQIPLAIMNQAVFEAPYIEVVRGLSRADLDALPSDVGYLMTVAQDPGSTRDYTITVSTDSGSTYSGAITAPWAPTALIVEGDALTDAAPATAFTLSGGVLLTGVVVGSAALWDNEIVRVDAIDAAAATLSLGRGCADTVPAVHAANSRIWFFDGFAGYDTTEYTDGESIDVELLTNTGSAQLDQDLATPLALTFDQRQFRPYPPAQLQINGTWYPSVISGDLSIAAVDRNRITQADQLIDTTQAAVAPESGTTYTLRLYNENDALVRTAAGLATPVYTWAEADELADSGLTVPIADLWTPADLAVAPAVWLNDDSPVTQASGAVSQWSDISGNGRHFDQPTASWQPVLATAPNGRRVVQFDGGDDFLDGTATCASISNNVAALSSFVVANPAIVSTLKRVLSISIGLAHNTSSRASINVNASNVQAVQRRTDGGSGTTVSLGITTQAWHIQQAEYDFANAALTVSVDGGAQLVTATGQGAGNTSATDSDAVSLGGDIPALGGGVGQNITGSIGEVIVLGYIATAADRQKIEGYLAWRWGLQTNLPADHPYRSAAPTSGSGQASRRNGRIRVELESLRDGVTSWQRYNVTVHRGGYGFSYGYAYGGPA